MSTLAWSVVITAVGIGALGAYALLVGLLMAAGAARPKTRAAAPASTAVPPRDIHPTDEQRLCYRRGHKYVDWARTATHFVCIVCGDAVKRIDDPDADLPFDQDAADLIAETEAHLGGAA